MQEELLRRDAEYIKFEAAEAKRRAALLEKWEAEDGAKIKEARSNTL